MNTPNFTPPKNLYHRQAFSSVQEALADSPVVLIHGPRQCGKTTLALQVAKQQGYHYLSFDVDDALLAAKADPVGFVRSLPERCILDEIQRAPELFTSLKDTVDRRRDPGRFILAGSANILLLPKLADSLAGRMAIVRLRPLAQCELAGAGPGFLPHLFHGTLGALARQGGYRRLGPALAELICAGGYPPALARVSASRRANWHVDYIVTIVQRDMQDISRIGRIDILPQLMELVASQTARLFNSAGMASSLGVSPPTIRDYLALLEQVFLIERLPPWHSNRLSRLIKTPKLHLTDTGLAAALLGVKAEALWQDRPLLGQLLETWVHQEVRKQADWQADAVRFHHYRNKDKVEVDLVLQQGRSLAAIEVKAAASLFPADFNGLKKLRAAEGKRFVAGALFYDGEAILPFGDRLHALPLSLLAPAT